MIALAVLIVLALKALNHNERRREDGEVAAVAETVYLAYLAVQFAVIFVAIGTRTIHQRSPPYEGAVVPN